MSYSTLQAILAARDVMSNITAPWQETCFHYYHDSDTRKAVKMVMYFVFQYHMQRGTIWSFTRRQVEQQQGPAAAAAAAAAAPLPHLRPLEIEECARAAAAAALCKLS